MYPYDIEESVEDALVAYLQSVMPSGMRHYTGGTEATLQYPCTVSECSSSQNVSTTGLFTGRRQLVANIQLFVEAATEQVGGTAGRTPREVNREYRRALWTALAYDALHEVLNALPPVGVAFSMAHPTTSTRAVDGRVFTTVVTLDVIAQPVEV